MGKREVEKKFVPLKVEAYYDIIKELIFANLYQGGYNCSNHKCLVAYVREKSNLSNQEIRALDELRKLRNDIGYRGFRVGKGYFKRSEGVFKQIISKLTSKPL